MEAFSLTALASPMAAHRVPGGRHCGDVGRRLEFPPAMRPGQAPLTAPLSFLAVGPCSGKLGGDSGCVEESLSLQALQRKSWEEEGRTGRLETLSEALQRKSWEEEGRTGRLETLSEASASVASPLVTPQQPQQGLHQQLLQHDGRGSSKRTSSETRSDRSRSLAGSRGSRSSRAGSGSGSLGGCSSRLEEPLRALQQALVEEQGVRLESVREALLEEKTQSVNQRQQLAELLEEHLQDFDGYIAMRKPETYEVICQRNRLRQHLMPAMMQILGAVAVLDAPQGSTTERLQAEERAVLQSLDSAELRLRRMREETVARFREQKEELEAHDQARRSAMASLMPARQRLDTFVRVLADEMCDETVARSQLHEGRLKDIRDRYNLMLRANDMSGMVWAQAEVDAAEESMAQQRAECAKAELLLERWGQLHARRSSTSAQPTASKPLFLASPLSPQKQRELLPEEFPSRHHEAAAADAQYPPRTPSSLPMPAPLLLQAHFAATSASSAAPSRQDLPQRSSWMFGFCSRRAAKRQRSV